MKGTSANLKYGIFSIIYSVGEIINLMDLFYGMMLPSGNDAATVIAEGLGLIIYLFKNGLFY
jgi:D-alanyl-D-alanine carboxypeptidase